MIKSFLIGLILGFGLFFSQPALNISVPISKSISEINLAKEKGCLVEALYHEARSESEEGIKAVLSVIKNRKNAEGFPSTFCGVVHEPKQFSFRNSLLPGQKMPVKPVKPLDKEKYILISSLADEALVGRFKPVLEPHIKWYLKNNTKPAWTKNLIKYKEIGRHTFYGENII